MEWSLPAKTVSYAGYAHEVTPNQSQVSHERTISKTKRPDSHVLSMFPVRVQFQTFHICRKLCKTEDCVMF